MESGGRAAAPIVCPARQPTTSYSPQIVLVVGAQSRGARFAKTARGAHQIVRVMSEPAAADPTTRVVLDGKTNSSNALYAAIDILRRRWSPAILQALSDRPMHY